MESRRGIVVLVPVLLALATPADAATSAACCAGKLTATAAREDQLFRCHARAAAHGTTVDPACVAAEAAALARAFARVVAAGGCDGADETAVVQADLVRVATDVAASLRPVPDASACTARKLKAAGRLAAQALRAFARHAPRPADQLDALTPVVSTLQARFADTFTRLEARGTCTTIADASTIATRILVGVGAPTAPDGVLLASLRVCPACGDGARGGTEACDGGDAPACPGACDAACSCPVCGDGVRAGGETCDGGDAPTCAGLCQADCTCPAPVCGNGVVEAGEPCDGAAQGVCAAPCQPDCTCGPAVCGNGVVEPPTEACEGSTCFLEGLGLAGCGDPGSGNACQCCDAGFCGLLGCCHAGDVCLPAPGGRGACVPGFLCTPGVTCTQPGHQCLPIGSGDAYGCFAELGNACISPPNPWGAFIPCVPPNVCSSSFGVCVAP